MLIHDSRKNIIPVERVVPAKITRSWHIKCKRWGLTDCIDDLKSPTKRSSYGRTTQVSPITIAAMAVTIRPAPTKAKPSQPCFERSWKLSELGPDLLAV